MTTITERSTLREVALVVGRALAHGGLRAVLTGGACASLYSSGRYRSDDLDFVLAGRVTVEELDRVMASVGFDREANRYVHRRTDYWVEFPRGPLAVGADLEVEIVEIRGRAGRTLALSPTDSCRDRLAAFYHWSDRQSLEAAVAIAARHDVDRSRIRRWSRSEGHVERFEEFERELERRTTRKPTTRPSR